MVHLEHLRHVAAGSHEQLSEHGVSDDAIQQRNHQLKGQTWDDPPGCECRNLVTSYTCHCVRGESGRVMKRINQQVKQPTLPFIVSHSELAVLCSATSCHVYRGFGIMQLGG